jgi:site-specific recombinase XerD
MIQQYLDYLEIEKNYSKNTIKQYEYDLKLFQSFVKIDLLFCSIAEVRSFLAHLKRDRNYSAKTLMRKQASLRSFYRFCVKQKKITSNPLEEIENPKLPQRIAVYLTETERKTLFDLARQKAINTRGIRNYVILVMLYYTGLRIHELINLDKTSFISDGLQTIIKVVGKGNKERIVPVHNEAKNVYEIWLKNRPQTLSQAVFVGAKGERLSIRSVQKMLQKLTKEAGISKKITPHKLRHTLGTDLLKTGANLIEIQNILGHANVSTTQIYAHTTKESLVKAIDRL